jgi:hypothetical protein
MRIGWSVTVTLIAIICAYGTTCVYTKIKREAANNSVSAGDTEDFAIAQFGTPSVRRLQISYSLGMHRQNANCLVSRGCGSKIVFYWILRRGPCHWGATGV